MGVGGADRQSKTQYYPVVWPDNDESQPETSLFHDMSRNYGIVGYHNQDRESSPSQWSLPNISTKKITSLGVDDWNKFFKILRTPKAFTPHYWNDIRRNRLNMGFDDQEGPYYQHHLTGLNNQVQADMKDDPDPGFLTWTSWDDTVHKRSTLMTPLETR